jgi:hypothetical protein
LIIYGCLLKGELSPFNLNNVKLSIAALFSSSTSLYGFKMYPSVLSVSVKLQEGNGIKFHIVEKKTSPY